MSVAGDFRAMREHRVRELDAHWRSGFQFGFWTGVFFCICADVALVCFVIWIVRGF